MNNTIQPVSVLKQKHIDVIRDSAARAEKDGKLTKAQINIINEQNWFKILAPSSLGGLQLPLPDALLILEALACADGSTGWTVTRCAIAGWSAGFLNADIAKEIFSGDKACIAGSGEATGTAEKTKSGYTVNGKWSLVSGTHEATAFIANCVITQNGTPVKDEDNKTQVLAFLFLNNEATVLPTWNAMGLAGTSCNDIEVKNLKVPSARAFKISGDNAKSGARLYQYPLQQLSEAAMSVNISGMAFHFIDVCRELLTQMKNSNGVALINDNLVDDTFDKYIQKLNDARVKLFYAVELTWQSCVNQQQIKDTILYKVSAASQDLTKRARECVDALYPFCGISSTDKGSEINRIWRDLHTASHESLLVYGGI